MVKCSSDASPLVHPQMRGYVHLHSRAEQSKRPQRGHVSGTQAWGRSARALRVHVGHSYRVYFITNLSSAAHPFLPGQLISTAYVLNPSSYRNAYNRDAYTSNKCSGHILMHVTVVSVQTWFHPNSVAAHHVRYTTGHTEYRCQTGR